MTTPNAFPTIYDRRQAPWIIAFVASVSYLLIGLSRFSPGSPWFDYAKLAILPMLLVLARAIHHWLQEAKDVAIAAGAPPDISVNDAFRYVARHFETASSAARKISRVTIWVFVVGICAPFAYALLMSSLQKNGVEIGRYVGWINGIQIWRFVPTTAAFYAYLSNTGADARAFLLVNVATVTWIVMASLVLYLGAALPKLRSQQSIERVSRWSLSYFAVPLLALGTLEAAFLSWSAFADPCSAVASPCKRIVSSDYEMIIEVVFFPSVTVLFLPLFVVSAFAFTTKVRLIIQARRMRHSAAA